MRSSQHIDLRKELEILQNTFSYCILYSRATKKIRCKCFDDIYHSGQADCEVCMGKGYVTTLERIPVIDRTTKSSLIQRAYGEIASQTKIFYFDYQKSPKVNDHIILAGWASDNTPLNAKAVYRVESIDTERGQNGRVEFYAVTAKLDSKLLNDINESVRRLPIKHKRLIAKGGRCSWPIQQVEKSSPKTSSQPL